MNYITKLKRIINRFYGKYGQYNFIYGDTDSAIFVDCDFCRNANTCSELNHANDLSYMACGIADKGFRMLFSSGGKMKTELLVEQLCITGLNHDRLEWQLVARFIPNYCPFCGRPLFENMIQKENKNG